MLKKHHQFYASLLWLFDMAVVLTTFAIAYQTRFFWQSLIPVRLGVSPAEETLATVVSIAVIWTLVFRWSGLYDRRRTARHLEELFLLLKATLIGVVCLVAVFYFFRELRYSRLTIGLFGLFSFVGLALTRGLAWRLIFTRRRRLHAPRRAIVVGTGQTAVALVERFDQNPYLRVKIVGLLDQDQPAPEAVVAGHAVIGRYDELGRLVRDLEIDEVYLALPLEQQHRITDALAALGEEMVDIKVVPDLVPYYTLRGGVEDFYGLPLVHLQHGPAVGWDAVAKRTFDLALGSLALLLVSPVMAIAAALVKATSKGPVFYGQERMGLDGRVFKMLKFRSMRVDAEIKTGAVWAKSDDDRTTVVGKWMRKLSVDELPQLLNVIRGDMSLVGPRPERPVFIDQFKKEIKHYNLRHKVKSGITGLAQVEGWRGDTSLHKRIERDLYYIEHWSLWLDLKILARTALGGFISRNAY
ncbi:MAG: undecaprenyl-phosphate glucose phosphotransferase [Deltaproteobacteria bacterium]|nr:undecaprenyl-phosphate glucose phosphotransferase [Deltaproteobacteria bacterium]